MLKKTVAQKLLVACALATAAALPSHAADFSLTSNDIANGQQLSNKHVFKGFGCEGEDQSPQLAWSNPPEGTKSFVVTAYDPDAPTGSGWWHWVAFNLPADARSLVTDASAAGKMPEGTIEARSDFGSAKFGGACPPPGRVHRYIFTVYALGVDKLPLDASATPALVGFMTRANALGSAKITAVYNR